ncbi:transposable element Tcb2 transposase [Trichonephila clavipes]|nr:transposable element Tcb2 transposase [Trichonephila clavipes]
MKFVCRVAGLSSPSVNDVMSFACNGVFQQDNCTCHKSRLAIGWLGGHYYDFSVINWSPRRPDLNPIEHLSKVLKQDVKGHHTASMNLTELRTAVPNI